MKRWKGTIWEEHRGVLLLWNLMQRTLLLQRLGDWFPLADGRKGHYEDGYKFRGAFYLDPMPPCT